MITALPMAHPCIFSFFAGSPKKLLFALHGHNLSTILEACNRETGTKEIKLLFNCVVYCQKIFAQIELLENFCIWTRLSADEYDLGTNRKMLVD